MKKLLLAFALLLSLTGCASLGGNEAFASAHKSAADSRIAEVTAESKADEVTAMAVASITKGCEGDICRVMALQTITNLKLNKVPVAKTPAPVIAPPVNEALSLGKYVLDKAVDIYSLRLGALVKFGDMSRGAADPNVLGSGLKYLDVYNDTTTTTTAK